MAPWLKSEYRNLSPQGTRQFEKAGNVCSGAGNAGLDIDDRGILMRDRIVLDFLIIGIDCNRNMVCKQLEVALFPHYALMIAADFPRIQPMPQKRLPSFTRIFPRGYRGGE